MLRVCTSSTEELLAPLTTFKRELGITTTSDDDLLTEALADASQLVQDYLGYPLHRQVYSESLAGPGSQEFVLARRHVRAVENIYYAGEALTTDSYETDGSAGLVRVELGVPWTPMIETELVEHPLSGQAYHDYTVDYEAGYLAADTASTANGAGKPWLTTSTGRDMPRWATRAALITAKGLWLHRQTMPGISSKRVGDLAITYATFCGDIYTLTREASAMLDPYRFYG